MSFDKKFFHKQKFQGWFTEEKWEVECGIDLLLHELLLSPTDNTATAFLDRVKRKFPLMHEMKLFSCFSLQWVLRGVFYSTLIFFLPSFLTVVSRFPSTSSLPKRSKVGIASTWNTVTVETSAYSSGHAGLCWGTLGLLQHHISPEHRRWKS